MLLVILFPLLFLMPCSAQSDPFQCSSADLSVTTECRPKLTKLTSEMKRFPAGKGLPDPQSLEKMAGFCKDAMNCINKAKCAAIRNKVKHFNSMCETIEFLGGPYAQCSQSMKASANKAACIEWFYKDKSLMTNEQKCGGFKKNRQCIEHEIRRNCGGDVEKDFQEKIGFVMKMVGCA